MIFWWLGTFMLQFIIKESLFLPFHQFIISFELFISLCPSGVLQMFGRKATADSFPFHPSLLAMTTILKVPKNSSKPDYNLQKSAWPTEIHLDPSLHQRRNSKFVFLTEILSMNQLLCTEASTWEMNQLEVQNKLSQPFFSLLSKKQQAGPFSSPVKSS